jgi:hypothetical protein
VDATAKRRYNRSYTHLDQNIVFNSDELLPTVYLTVIVEDLIFQVERAHGYDNASVGRVQAGATDRNCKSAFTQKSILQMYR